MSLKTIKDGVIALIATVASGANVVTKVSEALAEAELTRRSGILTKAYSQFATLEKNLQNINKPDNVFSNAAGDKMEFFSEKRKGEIAKAKASLEKLETAVAGALGEHSKWDELEKLLQSGSAASQNAPKSDATE